jgi:hypothetical protein
MPKKKKTLKQKLLSDHRREANNTASYSFVAERLESQSKQPIVPSKEHTQTISTKSYGYLATDLRKTALFTIGIIVIELVIRFLTKGV